MNNNQNARTSKRNATKQQRHVMYIEKGKYLGEGRSLFE